MNITTKKLILFQCFHTVHSPSITIWKESSCETKWKILDIFQVYMASGGFPRPKKWDFFCHAGSCDLLWTANFSITMWITQCCWLLLVHFKHFFYVYPLWTFLYMFSILTKMHFNTHQNKWYYEVSTSWIHRRCNDTHNCLKPTMGR